MCLLPQLCTVSGLQTIRAQACKHSFLLRVPAHSHKSSLQATCFSSNSQTVSNVFYVRLLTSFFKHLVGVLFEAFLFQMAAFAQRLNDVTSYITHISELVVFRKYPIERADKVATRFGDRILVSIRDRDTPDQPQYSVPSAALCICFPGRRHTGH